MKGNLFFVLILLMGAGFIISGCASTSTSVLYDTPNWMPDGRIICGKLVLTTSQQLYGGGVSSSKGYMTAFYPSGTGEVDLFEAPALYQITCSPTSELIAAVSPYYNGTNYTILIYDYKGNVSPVPNTANVQHLDWSPDAKKLVYSDFNRDMYVINRDGSGKTKIATSAEAVAWRAGDKIVFEYIEGGYIYLGRIMPDGLMRESYGSLSVYMPQISSTNSNHIYGKASLAYRMLDVSSTPTEEVLISPFDLYKPRLSFDDQKLVSGAYGSDPGIWLINIDGTGYKKIR